MSGVQFVGAGDVQMSLARDGGWVGFGGLGGQGVFLEGRQLRCAALDGALGLSRARSVEVVTGGDLGQPALEAVQVGLGLLDLGVGSGSRGATLGLLGRVGCARGPTGWAGWVRVRWPTGYAGRPPP